MSAGLRNIILSHQLNLSDAVKNGYNGAQFSCLIFALQLPSICARLDFPRDKYREFYSDGNPRDKTLYVKWLEKNHDLMYALSIGFLTFNEFCLALYELRCSLTHEGIVASNKKLQNIRFLSGEHSAVALGSKQYIPLYYLCYALFEGALRSVGHSSKTAVTDTDSLVVDISELSDAIVDMRRRAEEFWGKKSDREYVLYTLYDYLAHFQWSVLDKMESHFADADAKFSFSTEIVYYGRIAGANPETVYFGGMDRYSLETLGKLGIFRAKDSNQQGIHSVYMLFLDTEAYWEMKKIVREFRELILGEERIDS